MSKSTQFTLFEQLNVLPLFLTNVINIKVNHFRILHSKVYYLKFHVRII